MDRRLKSGRIIEEILKQLINAIIKDFASGIAVEKAGWCSPSELGINREELYELSRTRLIQQNSDGRVRVNFEKFRFREGEREFHRFIKDPILFKQLKYYIENQETILKDEYRIAKTSKILERLTEMINEENYLIPSMVLTGFWCMFLSSEMAVVIDDVLKAGFSPKDWVIYSSKAKPKLAKSLANKIGEIEDINTALENLKRRKLIKDYEAQIVTINDELYSNIEGVLKWEEIVNVFDHNTLLFLGLFWFALFLLEYHGTLTLSEGKNFEIAILIEGFLESVMKKDWNNLMDEFYLAITKLEDKDISWAPNIIYLPKVI